MKDEIRKVYKQRRAWMSHEEVTEKSLAAARLFLNSQIYKKARQIMLYIPLGNETDTTAIIDAAFADGKTVVFPATDEKSGEITPYIASRDTVFIKGAFSVKEPINAKKADMSKTDVVLVPGIAFDKSGARIGFGKGCYDRLLEDSAAAKVGYCYDFQVFGGITPEEHDVRMNFLVTEKGLFKCE